MWWSGCDADGLLLYERYFAPRGIAVAAIDMPSVFLQSSWDSACASAFNVPDIAVGGSHSRGGAEQFGANVAVHALNRRLKVVACRPVFIPVR